MTILQPTPEDALVLEKAHQAFVAHVIKKVGLELPPCGSSNDLLSVAAGLSDRGALAAEHGFTTDVLFPGRADLPTEASPGTWMMTCMLRVFSHGRFAGTITTTLVSGRKPAIALVPWEQYIPPNWRPVVR